MPYISKCGSGLYQAVNEASKIIYSFVWFKKSTYIYIHINVFYRSCALNKVAQVILCKSFIKC